MNNFVNIIIPAYNEGRNIQSLYDQLNRFLSSYWTIDILFVDDGSNDKTQEIIKELQYNDSRVSYICLSRNFGHQAALKAGFDHARGDAVICMDADLQHPPELIPKMIEKWQEGYDVVYTTRESGERNSLFKRVTSRLFYRFINLLSDVPIQNGAADFRLLDRKVVDVLRQMPETNLFFRGMIPWLGFKQVGISYKAGVRQAGHTKFSLKKMLHLATCGLTSFSIRPLRLSLVAGFIFALLSLAYGLYAIIMALFTDETVAGWTSVIVSILFLSGIHLIVLGIMGEYIGKLFMEIKRRPHYVISDQMISLPDNPKE